jgi:tetratricopeptide (TPR) repeat protein
MNATASVVISVLAASAAAVGVTIAMQPHEPSAPTESPVVSELKASLRQLEATNRELSKRLDALGLRAEQALGADAVQRSEAPVVSTAQVAAAVEAYLTTRGSAVPAAAGADDKPQFSVEDELESLFGSSYWEDTELWKRLHAAGKMDEAIAALEQRAQQNPKDVGSQMDLANAYMAYLQMDNSKWQYSMKADEQFDKVLGIDNRHWEARFTKAMSYTFWPAFLGKQKDAISHFETLIDQQNSMPVEEHHSQTYLFLGNMLMERDPERAREIWQMGAQRHPNNEELRERLGGN